MPNLLSCAAHEHTPQKFFRSSRLEDRRVIGFVPGRAWGKGYFSINARVTWSSDLAWTSPRDRSVQVVRTQAREPAPPSSFGSSDIWRTPAPHRGCLRHGHRGKRLQNRYAACFPSRSTSSAWWSRGLPLRARNSASGSSGLETRVLAVMSITENAPDRIVSATASRTTAHRGRRSRHRPAPSRVVNLTRTPIYRPGPLRPVQDEDGLRVKLASEMAPVWRGSTGLDVAVVLEAVADHMRSGAFSVIDITRAARVRAHLGPKPNSLP